MSAQPSTYEAGYKPVLIREETKEELRQLRATLEDRDLYQERRIATCLIELGIQVVNSGHEGMELFREKSKQIVLRDIGMN